MGDVDDGEEVVGRDLVNILELEPIGPDGLDEDLEGIMNDF